MAEEEETKISKYSSGVNQLKRLDSLWIDVNNHSRNGSFGKWNADLDRIWCELARDLIATKYEIRKKALEKIETELFKKGNFNDKAPEGFEDPSETIIKKRDHQYKQLMEKELFLRRLENELGKGTSFDDDDDDGYD